MKLADKTGEICLTKSPGRGFELWGSLSAFAGRRLASVYPFPRPHTCGASDTRPTLWQMKLPSRMYKPKFDLLEENLI